MWAVGCLVWGLQLPFDSARAETQAPDKRQQSASQQATAALPQISQQRTAAFQRGIAAFQAGELEAAARHLETAHELGMDSAALHYNLGVVYFRQQAYAQARAQFLQLVHQPKTEALARYNLGLVAVGEGDQDEALRQFRQVYQLSDEDKLRALAFAQLQRLEPREPVTREVAPSSTAPRWAGVAMLAAGHDSNASQLPDDLSRATAATFTEGLAAASGYAWGQRTQGLRLDASLYQRSYWDESDLSQGALQLGGSADYAWSDWWTSMGLRGEAFYIGGDLAERRLSVTLTGQRPVGSGLWRGTLRLTEILAEPAYESLDGEQFVARLEYRRDEPAWDWFLGYELELNQRADLRREDLFYSQSPRRQRLYLGAGWPLANDWLLEGRLDYRHSQYSDPYRFTDANGTIREERQDRRLSGTLRLGYQLSPAWQVYGQALYQDNHSSLSLYGYDRQELQLGLEWLF